MKGDIVLQRHFTSVAVLRHLDQIVMAKAEIQAVGRGKLPVNELGAVDAFKDRGARIMKMLAVLLDM